MASGYTPSGGGSGRSASAADWKELLAARQAELRDRIADYSKTIAPADQMLKNLADPPVQVGTGVWEGHNHVLATVLPEPREVFWGDWIGGIYEHGSNRAAVFALAKHERVNANTFCELPVNIPLSGRRDRLALLVYLADTTKESLRVRRTPSGGGPGTGPSACCGASRSCGRPTWAFPDSAANGLWLRCRRCRPT